MRVNVEFEFLGNRNYIHSTQMTYKLLSILYERDYYKSYSEIMEIKSIFRKLADKQGYFSINEETNQDYSTLFQVVLAQRKINIYFYEGDTKVINRVPYDEISLIEDFNIYKNQLKVDIEIKNEFNIYNVLIAMLKQLLHAVFPIENYTGWLVGKYKINWSLLHMNPIGRKLSIQINNNIDQIYTHSKIFLDDSVVGIIDNARKKIGD